MHSSGMRTARPSPYGGSLSGRSLSRTLSVQGGLRYVSLTETPPQTDNPPPTEIPLDRDPPVGGNNTEKDSFSHFKLQQYNTF